MVMEKWTVYLSGEIHSDWRDKIREGCLERNLPVVIVGPITNHEASDNCGVKILGKEDNLFWKDHKGAKINAIRTRSFIEKADVIVIKFGDKFRQWNAAFDAGIATALGKPIIVLHSKDLTHALREIDAAALAVAEEPTQVVQVLDYAINGNL